jgi:hypothetical protein
VLEHPGGGLAPWNATAHELGRTEGRVEVDGRPLVFYHHHSLRLYRNDATGRTAVALGRLRPGVPPVRLPWRTNYDVGGDEQRLVWAPYLAALGEARLDAEARAPGVVPPDESFPREELLRSAVRYARRRARAALRLVDPARFAPGRWTRYRDSWHSTDVARQMLELTNSQLEHPDDVPPYRAFRDILSLLVADPALPRPARLLDIGAGAGAYGELVERWAPGAFEYTGADYAEEILATARARWPGREFVRRDVLVPGALDGYDVVLASALLDVLADVEPALENLLAANARWVVLHRQRLDPERTHVEVVGGYRGQRTYAAYLTQRDLERAAERHGRQITASVEVDGGIRSFVLERRC